MDYFRRIQFESIKIGPGGVNCNCCNNFCMNVDDRKQKRLGKQKLHRATRRIDRQLVRRLIYD